MGFSPVWAKYWWPAVKRRRSDAPGRNNDKETVRAIMIFKELIFFRTEWINIE